MLMCGNADYSKFKPYHELSVDFSNDSSDIEVSEIRFTKQDNGDVVAFFAAKSIQGLYKSEEHTENKLYYLVFHNSEYELYSSKEKKKVKVEPSPFEKLVIEFFKSCDENDSHTLVSLKGEVYTGTLSFFASAAIQANIKATNAWNVVFNLTPIEGEPTYLKEAEASSGRRGYGSSAQKESEKLKDRLAFVLEQLNLSDCKTMLEAAVFLKTEGSFPKVTQEDLAIKLIELCIK